MFGPHEFYGSFASRFILAACGVALFLCAPISVSAQQAPSTPPATAAATSAKPSLSGTWILNKSQSDDPRQKMQEAMGNSGGEGEGGGGGWQGRHGGHGGHGGGMMEEMNQLTVTQSGSSVKIMGASGRLLTQTSDNASANSQPSNGSDSNSEPRFAPPVAQWEGNQLVSVMEGRRGKTTRTYELSPDGTQLFVTTKIENERFNGPVTFRQVYDPSKTGSQPPSQ
ncbi:MAG TPA: hypothetical protein VMJ93_09465 [Verrucomicrobiae bacterium]|nr:hypothetical protein [Verrucomicrobiae bacterium]